MTFLETTLRYVHEYRDRHGKVHRYFRRREQPLIRLPGKPGSKEFIAAYGAAYAGIAVRKKTIRRNAADRGTIDAIISAYYQHASFRSLAVGSQSTRRRLLERFRKSLFDRHLATLERRHIAGFLSNCSPAVARNWLSALRALMKFAVVTGLIETDPTAGIERPKLTKEREGFHAWTEAEIAMYEARHPIGSAARLGMGLLLYTAQRRSDIIGLGPQHIRDGVIVLRQQKTGMPVEIPVHPELAAIIAASLVGHLAFLVSNRGDTYSDGGFGKLFAGWCREAGLGANCAAHGLRKAACRRLAEAGCTAPQIASISGHKTLAEVQRYIDTADRRRLAQSAIARLRGM
jgi:integrase